MGEISTLLANADIALNNALTWKFSEYLSTEDKETLEYMRKDITEAIKNIAEIAKFYKI